VALGHAYDTRVSMSAGYLVGTGDGPYAGRDLSDVFHHPGFEALTTIGYPPPWPLVAGLIYRVTYALVPSLLAYNLALKLPVIAATIALAYLVAATMKNLGLSAPTCRRAWIALLFNPLLLYTGAAWGQIDVIVTFCALAALVLVYAGRTSWSAVLLALAVCVKPTVLPVVVVVAVYVWSRSHREAGRYAAVFVAGTLVVAVAPMLVPGWTSGLGDGRWGSQVAARGGMTYTTVARLVREPRSADLSGLWWWLSMAWVVVLAVAAIVLRRGRPDFVWLVRAGTAAVLAVFLTRARVSEPNAVLLVPLVLLLVTLDGLDRRLFTAVWALPLAFTVFNASPAYLLWVAFPSTMERALEWAGRFGEIRLAACAALVVCWQIVGWWIVVRCLRRRAGVAEAGAT
jgi:hypothetical protein